MLYYKLWLFSENITPEMKKLSMYTIGDIESCRLLDGLLRGEIEGRNGGKELKSFANINSDLRR